MSGLRRFANVLALVDGALLPSSALRCAPGTHAGPQTRGHMTKARVAAVHRKVLAGETLDEGQERDIADRLRRQLGGDRQLGEDGQ